MVYGFHETGYTEGHKPVTTTVHLHYLRGEKGAVSFEYRFMADPAAAAESLREELHWLLEPMGSGVNWHSPVPLRDYQKEGGALSGLPVGECLALGSGPCYADGSSSRAEVWLLMLQTHGMEWLRQRLVSYYEEVFYDQAHYDSYAEEVADMDFGEALTALFGMLPND